MMKPDELQQVREVVNDAVARLPILSQDQMRELMRETVHETLTGLGVDQSDPLETQRDLAWLRDLRRASASARAKAGATLIGLLVAALGGAVWLGLRAMLREPGP